MKIPFNDLSFQNNAIREELNAAFERCLSDSVYIGGEQLKYFEDSFSNYVGTRRCVGTGNCTDAMEMILEVMGIGRGDEVIIPAYTWVSTASCIIRRGAKPVYVDVHPDYYTIDHRLIEENITDKTRAIIAVHFYGLPAEMDKIMKIARKYDLKVIEDCAQAAGAEFKGQKVGSLGHYAAFSFYPTKNLGALGDGGCILTDDDEFAEKCKHLGNHGQSCKNMHKAVGRNSRLDSLQAAMLNVKIKYLDKWNRSRISTAEKYSQLLRNRLVKLPTAPRHSRHIYHLYVIQVENHYEVQGFLEKRGIQTFIHYPMPLTEVMPFEKYKVQGSSFPVSKRMSGRILSLPMFYGIREQQLKKVCDSLKEAISFCG